MTWYIDGSIDMGNLDVFATDKTLGDYRVCMIDCDDETVSEPNLEANARLIAAAPDLLVALEAYELFTGSLADAGEMTPDAWIELDKLHHKACLALNRAKGAA